jgi:hypothetical protein
MTVGRVFRPTSKAIQPRRHVLGRGPGAVLAPAPISLLCLRVQLLGLLLQLAQADGGSTPTVNVVDTGDVADGAGVDGVAADPQGRGSVASQGVVGVDPDEVAASDRHAVKRRPRRGAGLIHRLGSSNEHGGDRPIRASDPFRADSDLPQPPTVDLADGALAGDRDYRDGLRVRWCNVNDLAGVGLGADRVARSRPAVAVDDASLGGWGFRRPSPARRFGPVISRRTRSSVVTATEQRRSDPHDNEQGQDA